MRHSLKIVLSLMLLTVVACEEVNTSPRIATESESQAVRQRAAEAEAARAEAAMREQAVRAAGQGPHAKPGFVTEIEDGRLWVLRPGEEKAEKHISLIGAGPEGMTLKALDRKTAIEYLATRPPYTAEVDGEAIWILAPTQEKTDNPVTSSGGPGGMTLKAVDQATLDAYGEAGM